MNRENYKLVLDKITSCPDEWDQWVWHCGTTHCFAGWAQILSGKPADRDTVRRDARVFLDLSSIEANYLFEAARTLRDFNNYDRIVYDGDGYDRTGYDRIGYDRDGRDRTGRDRTGRDINGYDRYGYDRIGYDCDGLDRNNKPKP